MIVAIDGPAGSGKSTVARALARELGLPFLDTGAMYRAVTLAVLRLGLDTSDEAACTRVAGELRLTFDDEGKILIDGEAGEPHIRSQEVDAAVSEVSAHAGVRRAIVPLQQAAASERGAVAEGRDMGTVVFPDTPYKFFLHASLAERARRRAAQSERPGELEAVTRELERRDTLDSGRKEAPLARADDARVIETEGASVEQVVARLLELVRGEQV